MNYYQHNIGDYRRDTSHLTLLEHGVYRQLIDSYYLAEQEIPLETEVVFRRLCAKTDDEKNAVQTILSEFFTLSETGWVHKRCEEEIAVYQAKAGRARDNGKLGGRPRKTEEVISDNQEKTGSKANQEPITKNQEPDKNTYSPEFEHAWKLYPTRPGANKKRTFSAWNARLKSGATVDQMTAGVERFSAYCKACNTEPNYIKQAYTFFGPDEHYLSDWTPSPGQRNPSSGKQSARYNYAAEAAAAREKQKGESHEHVIDGECTVIS